MSATINPDSYTNDLSAARFKTIYELYRVKWMKLTFDCYYKGDPTLFKTEIG